MLPEHELKNSLNDRRSFLKLLAAAPLFATIASRSLASTVAATDRRIFLRRCLYPPWGPAIDQCAGDVDVPERVTGTARGAASGRGCIKTIC